MWKTGGVSVAVCRAARSPQRRRRALSDEDRRAPRGVGDQTSVTRERFVAVGQEDPGASKIPDSTSSTSTLVGPRFCLRAKRGTWTPPSTKKNASPSSRNRTSDQLISCIPLQSIALPTEKHSSFGRYVAHRKTMLGRMSLELARINRCMEV